MELPVTLELMVGKGFRARAAEWSAEGDTLEEATRRLSILVSQSVAGCTQPTPSESEVKKHPILAYAGTWKDHPLVEEWTQAIEEYRAARDLDLNKDVAG